MREGLQNSGERVIRRRASDNELLDTSHQGFFLRGPERRLYLKRDERREVLTIHREKGRLNNFTIGFCGDLKFGRTVHSLVNALSRYDHINFVLISPTELKLPRYVKEEALKKKGIPYTQTTDLESVIPQLDILYMTRVQKERFFNEEDYLRLKDIYILTPEKLENAKADLSILHPLPRVNEITVAVDKDPRAAYWRQVKNGKYIRMALILKLLGIQV